MVMTISAMWSGSPLNPLQQNGFCALPLFALDSSSDKNEDGSGMSVVRIAMLGATAVCITGLLVMPDGVHAQGKAVKPRSTVVKPPSAPMQKEITEQTRIYQSRGEQVPADYVTDRSLLSYAITLLPDFDHSLAKLGPADRWLDIGAGQGRAILDYYGERFDAMHAEGREQRGSKARAVALSIEDRRTADWRQTAAILEPGKIEYRFGRRLREYAPDELGRFKLATDCLRRLLLYFASLAVHGAGAGHAGGERQLLYGADRCAPRELAGASCRSARSVPDRNHQRHRRRAQSLRLAKAHRLCRGDLRN